MTARRRTTVVATVCLTVSLGASVLLLRNIDRLRPQASIDDALYVSSPTMVKRASLGFRGLMACLYWTRTVQYFGHRHYDHAHSYNETGALARDHDRARPGIVPAVSVRRQLSGSGAAERRRRAGSRPLN